MKIVGMMGTVIATLRAERKERGLTQGDVAALMDVPSGSAATISDLEAGVTDPRLSTLTRYAAALGFELTLTPEGEES